LDEAKTRKDTAMMLEVFEQNLPALALYRRYGFGEMTRLFGWRRKAEMVAQKSCFSDVREISVIDASRMSSEFEFPNIPWQISRHAVLKVPGARVFGDGAACGVISDTALQHIRVHAFLVAEQDWNALRNILTAVIQQFPNREFFA